MTEISTPRTAPRRRISLLVAAVAAVGVVGGAAAGTAALLPASAGPTPMVFGTPLPLNPAAPLPSEPQLQTVLQGLANPALPFRSKQNFIEGGIGVIEGRTADRLMARAVERGYLPMSFQVTNIAPGAPGTATALITASGPNLNPVTEPVTFVNEGVWKISRASAVGLLTAAAG